MDNSEYYVMSFFGDSIKVQDDLEQFCQSMHYQHPDTFTIVNTNMGYNGLQWLLILIYMC